MHGPLIHADDVDDFIILRARAFTSHTRRTLVQDVLCDEDLSLLEWQLLFSIARFGSCHVGHITNHTSIDPAHGSRAATTLEKKGMILRVEDSANRRRKLVSLTPEGRTTFERIWPKARKVTSDRTDLLTRAEMQDLKRLLDIVNGVTPSSRGPGASDPRRAAASTALSEMDRAAEEHV